MKCDVFRDRLFDYLEGALADREGFLAHRATCPACADLLRGIEENERLLRAARAPGAPADLWPGIARAISAGRVSAVRWPLWAAAAVLLAAFVGLVLAGASAPPPGLDLVVRDAGPALGALVPRYEDVDTVTALADSLLSPFRHDY